MQRFSAVTRRELSKLARSRSFKSTNLQISCNPCKFFSALYSGRIVSSASFSKASTAAPFCCYTVETSNFSSPYLKSKARHSFCGLAEMVTSHVPSILEDYKIAEKRQNIPDFGDDIIVNDSEELAGKIKHIREGGLHKLQVISDFDMTMTRFRVMGKRGQSCHSLLTTENEEVNDKRRQIHAKYYPKEIDPSIPYEEKLRYMEEWWHASHELIVEGGVTLDDIETSVKNANIQFRERTRELLELLCDLGVPLLIFSAGIADIIEEVLRQKLGSQFPNVRVVSNRMEFDESGRLKGFKGKLIHVLNKNEHATKASGKEEVKGDLSALSRCERRNVILLGDHLGDLRMADGVDCEEKITVGFLNDNVDKQLEAYKAAYDIVVLNDGSMEVGLSLFQCILKKETGVSAS